MSKKSENTIGDIAVNIAKIQKIEKKISILQSEKEKLLKETEEWKILKTFMDANKISPVIAQQKLAEIASGTNNIPTKINAEVKGSE